MFIKDIWLPLINNWYCYNQTLLQKSILNFYFRFHKYINIILSLSWSSLKVSTWIILKLSGKMLSFIHSFTHSIIHSFIQSVSQPASQPASQSFTHYLHRHRIIASKKFTYCHMKIKKLEIHFILKNIIIIKNRNNQLLERTEYGQIYEDILCILQYRSTQIHILC